MARKKRKKMDHRIRTSKGVRGLERKEDLARGGQQHVIVRSGGVKASRTKDRKKEASRRACRGRVRSPSFRPRFC